jgi:putative FmdB family regulatory protein
MPIYEYLCKECGTEFDALRSMKDADTVIVCKKCQSDKTQRKLSKCFANSGGHTLAGSGHSCSGGCGGGGNCSHCNN